MRWHGPKRATAIVEGKEWPVTRPIAPEATLLGDWEHDLPAMREMPWFKRLPPEEREQTLAEKRESMGLTLGEEDLKAGKLEIKPMGDGRFLVSWFGNPSYIVHVVGQDRIVVSSSGPEYPFIRKRP
jgi:hypothetical protein